MSLRDAIALAAQGEGRFRLEDTPPIPASEVERVCAAARGCVVLWPLGNSADAVRWLIAALHAGVVPVVVPGTWPRGRLDAVRAAWPHFGFLDRGALELPRQPATTDPRVGLALLTSGSTGAPKVIATSLDNLDRGVIAIHAAQGLEAVDTTGVLLPLAYSYALVNQVLWAVRFGRRLTLTPGLAMPGDALRLLRETRAGMVCLVAHQARVLLRYGFDAAAALPDVGVLNFAGAPFPVSSIARLRALFPHAVLVNNYGCAEAMPRLTVGRVGDEATDSTWAGRPIDGIELRIAGDEPVGPITFRGPSTSLGVLDNDGALVPHPEWIPSGDLGRLEEGHLHVAGRHDQVVKVFGERISVVEIEDALRVTGAVEAMVWVGRDAQGDDMVRAVVTGAESPPIEALEAAFVARLPRNLWPREVCYAPSWPLLANEKTDAPRLKAMCDAGDLLRIWPRRGPRSRDAEEVSPVTSQW